ncbi:MAG: alpha/beta hydrolase family protein [Bosea sp. (in: a-proteobacteria)]
MGFAPIDSQAKKVSENLTGRLFAVLLSGITRIEHMRRRQVLSGAVGAVAMATGSINPVFGQNAIARTVQEVEWRKGPDDWTIYAPKGPGTWPGILMLHGSEGGYSGSIAVIALYLASYGYVTFPLPYSKGGNTWHAGNIHDVDLDRTAKYLGLLKRHEKVGGQKVGLYGHSRGAEHALLLTSLMARDGATDLPDAVAVHAPSDFVVFAFIAEDFNPAKAPRTTFDRTKPAWRWRGSSDGLADGTPIEIERFTGPLFISHGQNDRLWSVDRTRRLESRLKAAGRSPEVHYYPGEGHGFGPENRNVQNGRLLAFFDKNLST